MLWGSKLIAAGGEADRHIVAEHIAKEPHQMFTKDNMVLADNN